MLREGGRAGEGQRVHAAGAGAAEGRPGGACGRAPARAASGTRYIHLACTAYLTHLHTGYRSAEAIDAGGALPGYAGIIVRDGYAGYGHLTDALHAWCGAHLLRDLKSLYEFGRQAGLGVEVPPSPATPSGRRRAPRRPLRPPRLPARTAATPYPDARARGFPDDHVSVEENHDLEDLGHSYAASTPVPA